jgi:hypothetical protein
VCGQEHLVFAVVVDGLEDDVGLVDPPRTEADDFGAGEQLIEADPLIPQPPHVCEVRGCLEVEGKDPHCRSSSGTGP